MSHGFLHRASWRAFRLGALLLLTPATLVLLAGLAALWRVSIGPTEVTALVSRWLPVPVQAGAVPGKPAGRLTGDRIYLTWKPGHHHLNPRIILDVVNLRVLRQDGSPAVVLGTAHVAVPMSMLLRGRVQPLSMSAADGTVILRKSESGEVDLDWPGAHHVRSTQSSLSLEKLISFKADNVAVILNDSVSGHRLMTKIRTVELSRLRKDLTRSWAGQIEAALGVDAQPLTSLHALGRAGPGGVNWTIWNASVPADAFAAFLPVLRFWHLPVQMHVDVSVPYHHREAEEDLLLSELRVNAVFGHGTIDQTDVAPLVVMGGQVTATVRNEGGPIQIGLEKSSITMRDDAGHDATFCARGKVSVDNLARSRIMNGSFSADATTLDIAHLASIWPRFLMKGARRWVARNLTSGKGEGLRLATRLHSERGWAGLRPVATTSALSIKGATLHWLRPISPATDVSAEFAFVRPDALLITLGNGVQPVSGQKRSLTLNSGSVLIDGLFEHDQTGTIRFDLSGDLSSGLSLLAHPRLHLLSRHPLPFTHPTGSVRVGGELSLPLSAHIEDDQIHVTTHVLYKDVSLGDVVLGRGVTGVNGTIDATERHLLLQGQGLLGGVPTTARLDENFRRTDGPLREHVHAVSVFDPASLARAELGVGHLFDGSAQLDMDYVARFNGSADVRLNLDLAKAGLAIPVWRKKENVPATASAHIGIQNGAIVALDQVRAEGPDLNVEGNGVIELGQVRALSLAKFSVGRSQGDARIDLPRRNNDPIAVHVRAKTLDVRPLLHPDGDNPGLRSRSGDRNLIDAASPVKSSVGQNSSGGFLRSSPEKQTDWNVDIRAEQLFYSARGFFRGVVAHLVHRHNRLDQGSFTAEDPTHVRVLLTPRHNGRSLHAEIEDLGRLLRETGLTSRLAGGMARISGLFFDRGEGSLPPFKGVLSVTPFTFLKPPLALTAAAHLSVFQWSQASRDRFEVQHLHLPVSIGNDVMTIHDGNLGNPALGATLEGKIGLTRGYLDLNGTVVPVFGLNAAPGRLPNVGKLFSPEEGGGVLAATFTVKGTANDPDLSVNPFAMFLPGFMRQLAK